MSYGEFQIDTYESGYAGLVKDILQNGIMRKTRNAYTKSVFGRVLRINPGKDQFPILSGRRMFHGPILGELAAFLKGPKTLKDFEDQGCNYWSKWGNPDGSITLDYGNAWLDFNGVDQLQALIDGLRNDPHGRRHIITGWRPDRLAELNLPCCHLLYQWYVRDGLLDIVWYQRSVDTMIGLPSDVITAYMWNLLIANEVGLEPGELIMMLGDTHVYEQHFEGAAEYVRRIQNQAEPPLPTHRPFADTTKNFNPAGFILEDYRPMSKIEFELIA